MLLSRIAESLFWIGRYVERADGTARMVDVLRLQLLEDPTADEHAASRLVLNVIMGMPERGSTTFSDVGGALVFDSTNPGSITASWMSARENARRARETLPTELWEAINTTWHGWNRFGHAAVTERHLSWVRQRAALVSGMADATMNHDAAWGFMMLGRYLERADMTARLVATGAVGAAGAPWQVVLSSCGAQQAFLRSRRGVFSEAGAVEFLVLDRSYPRSVFFALDEAESRLLELAPSDQRIGIGDEARRQLGQIRTVLEYSTRADLLRDLPTLMERVQQAVLASSQLTAARYFHSGPPPAWVGEVV